MLTKRYTDFEVLRRALSENWYVPALFPRKQVFTGMGAWKDPTFLQDRQNQLALWVNSMLAVFQGQDIDIIPKEVMSFFLFQCMSFAESGKTSKQEHISVFMMIQSVHVSWVHASKETFE